MCALVVFDLSRVDVPYCSHTIEKTVLGWRLVNYKKSFSCIVATVLFSRDSFAIDGNNHRTLWIVLGPAMTKPRARLPLG